MTLTTTQSAELRQALDRVRRDKQEVAGQLRTARTEYGKVQHRLTEGKADQADAFAAKKEVDGLEAKQKDLRDEEATYLGLMGDSANGNGDGGNAGALSGQLNEVHEVLSRLANSGARMGDFPIASISAEEVAGWTGRSMMAAAAPAPTPGMLQGPFVRAVPAPTPPQSFLDLVPTQVMETPSVGYAQEVASAESSPPAPTAPGSVKPAVDFEYIDAEASPATIAGYLKQNRQTLSDVPMLLNLIQTRLMTRTRIALEHEVLSGTGAVSDRTGKPGITGLLGTTGIGAVTATAGELDPDAILDAIVTCLVSGARPNVVALNPVDWAAMLKTKSGGSQEYIASPFLQTVQSVWSVNLVPAVGIPPKKIVVADTNLALTLLVREGANIRVSDSDQDDFTRNRVTILCEGRWALAVWVPAAVCVVTLP